MDLPDKNELKEFAYSQGAQLCAVSSVYSYDEYQLEASNRLNETGAGFEDYMIPDESQLSGETTKTYFDTLSEPRTAMPEVKSIILIGVYSYDHSAVYRNTRSVLKGKTARIYSYYPVVRNVAESIVSMIENRGGRAVQGQHIPLKHLASQMGLASYGKNGILQTREYGSHMAFRNILTDLEVEPDLPETIKSPCEGCDKCLKACPTGALYAPYKVNPGLCINPITRKKDYIKPLIRSKMQNWIVGCDICQEVCPSNKDLEPRQADPRACFDPLHHDSHKLLGGLERMPSLIALLDPGNPFQIRRNGAIGLANTAGGDIRAIAALKDQLPSATKELREYLIWAIKILEKKTK